MSEAHFSKPPIRRQITATSHTPRQLGVVYQIATSHFVAFRSHTPPQLGVVYQVATSHFVTLTSHTPNFWGGISGCNLLLINHLFGGELLLCSVN
jgi:hypothetical protein